MKDDYKVTKVYPVQKSTSSSGRWAIMLDIEWKNGLKANQFEFYWKKAIADKAYYNFLRII